MTFRKTLRRGAVGGALTTAIIVASAGGALAHECFNASRSAQGNTSAGTHSQAWFQVDVAATIADEVDQGLYDEETGACILDAWSAGGGPATFTVHVKGANGSDGVIAAKNPHESKGSDGRGIDHFFDVYGELFVNSYAGCGANPFPE
jgi:hypothetical protein